MSFGIKSHKTINIKIMIYIIQIITIIVTTTIIITLKK